MSSESGNDSGGSSGSETDLGREAVVGQPFSDTDSASDVGASSRDGCSGMKKKCSRRILFPSCMLVPKQSQLNRKCW